MLVLKAAQEKLLAALQSVAGIVERRHTLPILANVMLRKEAGRIEFTTSDLEIQVRTSADLDGDDANFATTVAARKLIDILRSLPGDQTVSLTSAQSKLTLQAGRSRFTLQTLPAEDFPLVQDAADFGPAFSVPQATLKRLIDQVHFAMAVHDIRYYLNGILFVAEGTRLTLVATDGHRLALAEATLDAEIPKQEVILPRKTVLELQRLLKEGSPAVSKREDRSGGKEPKGGGDPRPMPPDEGAPVEAPSAESPAAAAVPPAAAEADMIEMRFAGNQARFAFSGMEFTTKLVEGKFPDYNRVIPKGHKNAVTLGRAPLLACLQRAAILTSEKFKGVRVNLEPGTLRIASSNAEQEEAKEEIEIDYGGDEIEIGFNVTYLTEVLANLSVDMVTIELQDANSSALMSAPEVAGFKYVVMPMRI